MSEENNQATGRPQKEKKKKEVIYNPVNAFNSIVEATSKYMQTIFPHIFELFQLKK